MFDICTFLKEHHNITLMDHQERAVNTIDGAILLLAVPGAGKTTVMVSRIANMIFKDNINPKSILTVTFSKASAEDMEARYTKLFSELHEERKLLLPKFSTIHSFAYQIIRDYANEKQGDFFAIISPLQCYSILKNIYSKINFDFLTEDIQEELIACFSYIQNKMLKKDKIDMLKTDINNIWELYKEYQSTKREMELMDFDDMLSYSYIILKKYPKIRERYSKRYKYICVDESQDTSLLQHKIIEILALPLNNLFLVGDEDQSIYQFRGASPETLLKFSDKYPNSRILKMEENFRSGKNIVKRANLFITQNKMRYPKDMYSNSPKEGEIKIVNLSDLSEQNKLVLETIHKENGTVALIYRNNFSSIQLVDVLDKNNIDFYIKDQKGKFSNHYIVRDIQAFLALSLDPSDYASFKIIFNKTGAYLGKTLLNSLNKSPLRHNETWFDRITDIENEKINTGKIRYISILISKLKDMHPVRALDTIYNSIGYLEFVKYISGGDFSNQINKMSAIKNIATRVTTVKDFLRRIKEIDNVISEYSSHKNSRLTLTTAHSAKGLEFDTVILIDLLENIFPTAFSIEMLHEGKINYMEEEARLFYVACTRARNLLIIPKSNLFCDLEVKESRFIARLTEDPQKKYDALSKITTGTRIIHKHFGDGQVLSVDRKNGRFLVFFKKSGTRNLSIDILNKENIIEIKQG